MGVLDTYYLIQPHWYHILFVTISDLNPHRKDRLNLSDILTAIEKTKPVSKNLAKKHIDWQNAMGCSWNSHFCDVFSNKNNDSIDIVLLKWCHLNNSFDAYLLLNSGRKCSMIYYSLYCFQTFAICRIKLSYHSTLERYYRMLGTFIILYYQSQ